jgi:HD-GYP domain-containing protein (c-di-GMP phosphodiesterase class II)
MALIQQQMLQNFTP